MTELNKVQLSFFSPPNNSNFQISKSKSGATSLTQPLSDGFNSIFADRGETSEKPVDDFNTKLNHMLLAEGGMHDLISISQHPDL